MFNKKESDRMYLLHIGKDITIDKKDIIGIFDIESLKKTKMGKEILENIQEKVVIIEEGKEKTLVLTKEKGETKGYISNILSVTLEKRCLENRWDTKFVV